MTFPGESIPVTSGTVNGLGAGFVTYRGGAQTLAGTPWVLWSNEPPLLLGPGDAAVVSWVVEVLSGSGTVTAEGTLHTSATEGTASWSSLGSHTVTGPATLVIPTSLDGADILGSLIPGLRMTASPSLVVEQVKLRVWPPGGVVGGWSGPEALAPLLTDARVTLGQVGEQIVNTSGGTDVDNRLRQTMTVLTIAIGAAPLTGYIGEGDPSWTQVAGAVMNAAAQWTSGAGEPATGTATGGVGVGYVRRPGGFVNPSPTGTFGVDWTYPPNEVWWDDEVVLFPLDPGDGTFAWGPNNHVTLSVSDASNGTDAQGFVRGDWYVRAAPVPDPADDEGLTVDDLLTDTPTVLAFDEQNTDPKAILADLPEIPAGWALRIMAVHLNHFSPDPVSVHIHDSGSTERRDIGFAEAQIFAGDYDGSAVTNRLNYYWTPPPFRYWTPTVVTLQPLRLMQRGDNLGMGSARLFGPGTRQGSSRAFGSL